jgi:hypothetical protein
MGIQYSSGYKERVARFDLTGTRDPLKPRGNGYADGRRRTTGASSGQGAA